MTSLVYKGFFSHFVRDRSSCLHTLSTRGSAVADNPQGQRGFCL